jgi:5-methylthioribose kinase
VNSRSEFQKSNPDVFFLDAEDLPSIADYLIRTHCIGTDEEVFMAEAAGEGNMNYTLRIHASKRSLIVKQARPWVEKHPQIPAPWDRAVMEARFYETIKTDLLLARRMPRLLGFDPLARILIMEDLGSSPDLTSIYWDSSISYGEIDSLTNFLTRLHSRFRNSSYSGKFENLEMRKLNHEHIFEFPLRPENGLDLDYFTPGLAEAAAKLQQNAVYCARVLALGDLYLGDGQCLIHGDYFPGSWLRTNDGVKIIDPEFCFFGLPEFELGVMIAHLHLAACPESLADRVLKTYRPSSMLDHNLLLNFAGAEIMRRLIGVAQLGLPLGLEEKRHLLDLSQRMVMAS